MSESEKTNSTPLCIEPWSPSEPPNSFLWYPRVYRTWTIGKSRLYKDCRLVDSWCTSIWDDGQSPDISVYWYWAPSPIKTGLPPFYDENVNTMYQRILADPLQFPPGMPPEAMSVMSGLLHRDPLKRLGANGSEEIKRHPFFSHHIRWDRYVHGSTFIGCLFINDWHSLLAKKIQPPFKPSVVSQINPISFPPLTPMLPSGICPRCCQLRYWFHKWRGSRFSRYRFCIVWDCARSV